MVTRTASPCSAFNFRTAGWCNVRLPALRRRTDLELLSVFDQQLQVPDKRHLLDVNLREIPERYDPVLRRMEGAAASIEVTDSMALEDEVAETWGRMKREIAAKDAVLAERGAALDPTTHGTRRRRGAHRGTGAPSGRFLGPMIRWLTCCVPAHTSRSEGSVTKLVDRTTPQQRMVTAAGSRPANARSQSSPCLHRRARPSPVTTGSA